MCRDGSDMTLAATVLLMLALPGAAHAQPATPAGVDLLSPAGWPPGGLPRPISAEAQPVTIDIEGLRGAAPGDQITLQQGATQFASVVQHVMRRSDTSWTTVCRDEFDPDGFLILCVEDDAVAGLIQSSTTGKLYRIGYVAPGVHEFAPVGPMGIPDCRTPDAVPAPAAPTWERPAAPRPPQPAGGCVAPLPNGDVMIFYTAGARQEAGGVSAMNAECQLAVDTANLTYANSFIVNQLTLVFRGEISYTEAGAVETDRNRLKGTSDGHMDHVHADRDAFGADYVTLFVRSSDADACGIAYCTPSGAAEGFCVVNWTCASGNFSFAHEIGHLQGCAHNREDAGSGCNNDCYSFGHRFFGNSGAGWRTVMAYDTPPDTETEFVRIGIWSNPHVDFDGQPCGVWTHDCDDDNRFNGATVTNTAPNREAWRNPRFDVWVERFASAPFTGSFGDPFATVQAGVNAVFSGGGAAVTPVLHIKAQTYAETMTISKPMTITACGGIARIGG